MPASNSQNSPENPALSLRSLVAILFRKKRLCAALFAAILCGVTLGTFLIPKRYEARLKILVKNERADLVVSPDARNGSIFRGDVNEAQVNSEIALLSGNELLQHVVRRCRLHRIGQGGDLADGSEASVERAVRKLRRDLNITPVRKANIIEITYASTRPELAAAVLRTLMERYLDDHLKVHRTPGTYEFFREQAAAYQRQLRDAETRLSEFRRGSNFVLIAEQKNLLLRRLIDAEGSLHEADASLAETTRRAAELRRQLAALEPRIVTQSRIVPNQYSVERLHTMLAKLRNRRSQLLMKYRQDDRAVAEIEDEIANTSAALDRAAKLNAVEQTTDVNPLRQKLESELAAAELARAGLASRRESLRSFLASYRARLLELEDATAEHDSLARALKESEENYLLYSRKQEEARIADSLDRQKIANVAIAEAPVVPHLPSKPNVGLNLLLGFLLAGFVSLGAAFGSEWTDGSFHTPEELESAAGIPVLATVPLQKT